MTALERRAAWMALSQIEGLGPRRLKRLYTRFGSVEATWDAPLVEIARLPGFHVRLAVQVKEAVGQLRRCLEFLQRLEGAAVRVSCIEDDDYPEALRTLPDPPMVLAWQGRKEVLSRPAVAIVGTRRPSREALALVSRAVSRLVSQGQVIVSGLALGIDQKAHQATLEAQGETIAIPGVDLQRLAHHPLAQAIRTQGLLLTEHLLPTEKVAASLVQRNRLISGLARLVLVIEGERGAWHTARFAHLQGKQVWLCRTLSRRYRELDDMVWVDATELEARLEAACWKRQDRPEAAQGEKTWDLFQRFPLRKT